MKPRRILADREDGSPSLVWQVIRNMGLTLLVGLVVGAFVGFGPVMALAAAVAVLFGLATAMRLGDNLEADVQN